MPHGPSIDVIQQTKLAERGVIGAPDRIVGLAVVEDDTNVHVLDRRSGDGGGEVSAKGLELAEQPPMEEAGLVAIGGQRKRLDRS